MRTLLLRDLAAICICVLSWGTSWYVITLQLGTVDAIASLAYRFALAAAVLFVWCGCRNEAIGLSVDQHMAALGVGLFNFTIDYGFTYFAEARLVSGVVAVIFAALAFVNLLVFRLAFGHRAPWLAWLAAAFGAAGVLLLSWSEMAHAHPDRQVLAGLLMAGAAVLAAAVGNVFARRGQLAGAPLTASVAWSMAYGAALLALVTTVRRSWGFDDSPRYVLSLLYLALVPSVLAFVLYFGLARRRGYTIASYTLALTPLPAIVLSTMLEGKRWPGVGLSGVVVVLAGQWVLLRVHNADGVPHEVKSTGEFGGVRST